MCLKSNEPVWGVTDLRLAFPQKKDMFFKDLSFNYQKGEKILFLGPSGCGKSTLLQVLSGLIPKSVPLPVHTEKLSIPKSWGFIFQDPDTQFCMPYVDEEIAFVLENRRIDPKKMPGLIHDYLKLTGLDFSDPHRLIRTLSGGMKQRLAIASVLALEPEVLFLDEPTALLDPDGTEQLWETVRRISKGRTLLIVEHKISRILDLVARIVLFDPDGRILADGPKDQVLEQYRDELDAYGIWHPDAWPAYERRRPVPIRRQKHEEPILDLKNFSVYHGRTKCFTVPELHLYRGEWVAVIGKNGAGKSTMVEGIRSLVRHEGIMHWYLDHKEEDVSFVFQNPEYQFVTDKVEDELGFSLKLNKLPVSEIEKLVTRSLEQFALTQQRTTHPYQLSVGQKRRLSVAASLIDRPQAVILDEPTFGQDARNTFALLDLFQSLVDGGTTVIMVTHEMEIVRRFATRVLTVADGRLIGDSRVPASGRGEETENGSRYHRHQ
ncbi:ABC transporter ATP-binding protein [Sporolactobacillus vineae]|uniref:ABC transporter ATP-binding protein n=1 Tax=Sporolactobacillus vineae TaxID=444463 RepID=UPI0002884A48|nr:ABC transporter ATP-binding protein [Sporolactobacillus vineae]